MRKVIPAKKETSFFQIPRSVKTKIVMHYLAGFYMYLKVIVLKMTMRYSIASPLKSFVLLIVTISTVF